METIECRRCQAERPALERPPFRNERGERIQREICRICWSEWLEHQTLLINHYGLDPREARSREFLYAQIDEVLLGDGKAEQVDTSKQGTIEW
jgi:Fe-S cluster biosynthesis and repair protein YggX